MGELIADLFVSLDGYAAADDVGPYFGYGGPELDDWIQTELDKPQVVVLGRVTYEELARISSAADGSESGRLTERPKIVVSSTLSHAEWANTRLARGDALRPLKRDSAVPLRTMGSVSMVSSVVDAALVDRLRLMVFPLVCASSGRARIFGEGKLERFELAEARVLDARVVLLDYRVAGRRAV